MLLGAYHTLEVVEETPHGLLLGESSILLPREQVPESCGLGDMVEVFVYADAAGRLVATTKTPDGTPGGRFACLEVVDRGPHGVFMDWGVGKDLLVPRREQVAPMSIGDRHVVAITEDRQGRAMGSCRIRRFLDVDLEVDELRVGQTVELMVYEAHERGLRVIVDGRWDGLVYDDEIYEELAIGTKLAGTVAKIREDAKLDIHIRKRGVAAMSADKTRLLEALRASDGFLPLHDKSPPEAIGARLQMSKKAFKRAVGGLLRAGLVEIDGRGTRLVRDPD